MLAYKIVQNHKNWQVDHTGRLFVPHLGEYILAATPTLGTGYTIGNYTIKQFLQEGIVEEVLLSTQRWAHPHLLKSVREALREEILKRD